MSMQNKAQEVLDQVKKAGAQGDLIIDMGQALSLKARDGELEEHKVTSSQIFGLRVIKDDRVGTAYSEATDEHSLSSLVEQALTNASYAAPEVNEKILHNEAELTTDDALLCPQEPASIEDKIALALRLEMDLSGRAKVKNVPYNGINDGVQERHVFSTEGLAASTRSRSCSAFAYALIEDGDKNAMEGSGQVGRLMSDINADELIDKVHRDALDILHGKPVPSAHYDVIFDKEMQATLFSVFSMMYSGKSAKDGINPMRDRIGETIADARLTITDRPDNSDGFGYALFDDEGTTANATPLIAEGKLVSLIHNSMTASYFDTHSTGHGTRSPRSTLGVGLHQVEMAAGETDVQTLQAGRYLQITDLTGLHSGANAISGDFSFGASGYLCEDGERIQPVRNITVAGNFYAMLNSIKLIGNQQNWNWRRSALMPSIRFADVAVSG